jgi:hypothetical protein
MVVNLGEGLMQRLVTSCTMRLNFPFFIFIIYSTRAVSLIFIVLISCDTVLSRIKNRDNMKTFLYTDFYSFEFRKFVLFFAEKIVSSLKRPT